MHNLKHKNKILDNALAICIILDNNLEILQIQHFLKSWTYSWYELIMNQENSIDLYNMVQPNIATY